MRISNAQQIREADRRMIEDLGFPGIFLMETAGRKAAELILSEFPHENQFHILCGPGNNGGDGLVIARYLKLAGKEPFITFSTDPSSYTGDAALAFQGLGGSGVPWEVWSKGFKGRTDSALIDALLGTGIKSALRGSVKEMIEACQGHPGPVIAVDLPSGLDADSGRPSNSVLSAQLSITFQLPKVCHWVTPAAESCGRIAVLDIGIWPEVIASLDIRRFLINGDWSRQQLKKRPDSGHKGTFGHALLIGGSSQFAGAIAMSAQAALHAGAGLSSLFAPEAVRQASLAMGPEVMCWAAAGEELGQGDLETIADLLEGKTLGIGPGMGQGKATKAFLLGLLEKVGAPIVLDADALNLLAQVPAWWERLPAGSVLTPHPGEMKRLANRTDVNEHRLESAEELAQKTACTVVLKGAGTIVASPDGRSFVNPTGNQGMATGGAGDVLTGLITGLLAQGHGPTESAAMGVYIHGLAGDLAAAKYGNHGLTAGRILNEIGPAIKDILDHQEPKIKAI